jgi:PTH1 family peptidyl-tRNA hydrolase
MKLIAGLGNPGPRYRGTLHNVGFDVVDELARRHGAAFESSPADALAARLRNVGARDVLLVKPLTFMNVSGRAVGALQRYYRIPLEDVLIVVDDVNLQAGRLRIRAGGSAGGHNGLKSIIEAMGTDAFPRLRVGVGRGDPQRGLADHVLAKAADTDREVLAVATSAAADAAELFVTASLHEVMNRFNAKREEPAAQDAETDEPGAKPTVVSDRRTNDGR